MIAFRDLPIITKLRRMSMLVSASVLLISCAAFIVYDLVTLKNTTAEHLSTDAQIVGINVTRALLSQDRGAAAETLAVLRTSPNIISAAVYTPDGGILAKYVRGFGSDTPALPQKLEITRNTHRIEAGHLIVLRQILSDGGPIGMVYIQSDLREIESRLEGYAVIAVSVLAVSFAVALLVSSMLQKRISTPILSLAQTARTITLKKDYSVRAAIGSKDEIGILGEAFNDMLRQIEEQNETLRESEQNFRGLANAMPQIVWTARADGESDYFNRQWFDYTGATAAQTQTWIWSVVLHPEDLAQYIRTWEESVRSGTPYNMEFRIRRASDGSYRWHLGRALPVRDKRGRVVRWFGTCTDIDDQKRAEEEVRALNVELEQRVAKRTLELTAANKELESFSYSVSHDLRTPLRAIDGFSRIVQEDYGEKLDEEGRRLLAVIRDNSQKMAQLIDDLLEFSRLGRKPLSVGEIDMKRMVEDVIGEVSMVRKRRPRVVLTGLPPAHGDAPMVKQAWTNLLANAIKFSSGREQPQIEVSGYSDGAYNTYCVRDNGAGFDMQYYDKLFGVFQRLHSTEEFPGTGVGLAIVQRVVTRHGGRVWAEGKPNEGAAFYFSLPKGKRDGQL